MVENQTTQEIARKGKCEGVVIRYTRLIMAKNQGLVNK